jgi:hypothetical protein
MKGRSAVARAGGEAVLVGLTGMHAVGTTPVAAGLPVTAAAALDHAGADADQHTDAGEHPHDTDCPGHTGTDHDGGPCPDTHDHAGQMCQSAAPALRLLRRKLRPPADAAQD